MIKTWWNPDFPRPEAPKKPVRADIKDDIAKYLEAYGPSMVEDLTPITKNTHVATRHILAEMRKEGRIISKRLNVAGNATYWANTIDDIDKMVKDFKGLRHYGRAKVTA